MLLLFLAFKLVGRLHNRSFLHWVVTLAWGVPTMVALIHAVGHLHNLLFDEMHSAHHLSQVMIIAIDPGLMEAHLICYEPNIGCYHPILLNTNTHHFINSAKMDFNIFQSGFNLINF